MISLAPKGIQDILKILWDSGYDAYLVGGCVRDRLLGFEPYDYDVTTNALPEEVKILFGSYKVIETGIKHGTVTVICDGEKCEITTYRVDGKYTDSRHPDAVTFSDKLPADLSRRDFTVNAMAYGREGLVDLFGGREDLQNKIIRAVGDPERRFSEDALRIMRALRFSSKLGFSIERDTAGAMRKCAHLLENVARERICTETVGIVMGKNAFSVTKEFADVLESALGKTDPVSDSLAIDPEIRLAALLKNNRCAVSSLKMSRAATDTVSALINNFSAVLPCDIVSAQRFIRKYGYDLSVKLCLAGGNVEAESLIKSVKKKRLPSRICDLAVRGEDIMRAGFSGGEISRALNAALDAVIAGECANTKKDILDYIRNLNF